MNIENNTLEYYDKNASVYVNDTAEVNFHEIQDIFISFFPENASILDFGCGFGRDTVYPLQKRCKVTAIHGSKELCRIARERTGIDVKQVLFQELGDENVYDGIWACSPILHLSKVI